MELSKRLEEVRQRIAEAALRSGRDPGAVTLLPVTKTFPPETVQEAYACGLREFGENRVQEALSKIPLLPPDVRWHLIGQLQSNKINKVLGRFALVHSVDSTGLAEAIGARLAGLSQDVLLEVNTSGEAAKSGVAPGDALDAARKIAAVPGLKLRGLMTVGPLTEDPKAVRDAFRRLKELFDRFRSEGPAGNPFDILSMGMSGDFEAAIEEGSTMVRVGSALFGKRG